MFSNPDRAAIEQLLRDAKTVAIVGLSSNPARPSHRVARALQEFGYRIIPVTPVETLILGERTVPDLDHLSDMPGPGVKPDIVDVFRRPEHVGPIVDACIRLGLPALWLQDGVIDEVAGTKAVAAGIFTVMDRCIFRDRAAMDR